MKNIANIGRSTVRRAFILDSTAFYAGIPYRGPSSCYTTQMVIDEVSHTRMASTVIKSLIDLGHVVVIEPSCEMIREAEKAAGMTGDIGGISKTDLSVVALGLELKDQGYDVTIVSDDYSIENLTKILNMSIASVMSRGISRIVDWLIYCRGCGRVFQNIDIVECDVCGTRLRRKIKKTSTSRASFKT